MICFLYGHPVGGLRSGLPGAATDQLQAVSRAQRPQDQAGYPAGAQTGMFICWVIPPSPFFFSFLYILLLYLLFPTLSPGAVPAEHEVRVHPGLLV